jgi:hypothetical protein
MSDLVCYFAVGRGYGLYLADTDPTGTENWAFGMWK